MFCEECKIRIANVHVSSVVNNNVFEMHLCSECAQKKMGSGFFLEPQISPTQNVFALLIPALIGVQQVQQVPDVHCNDCGCALNEFISSGFLGCSKCYKAFQPILDGFLRKIHGSTKHTGKILERRGGSLKIKRDVSTLKMELEKLVQNEEYEKAAKLRDKIKGLERENEGQ